MGLFEKITHKEEIESLISEAERVYYNAQNNFDNQKEATAKSLETLGRLKLEKWSDDMSSFIKAFESFKNLEVHEIENQKLSFYGQFEEPRQMMVNIANASLTAKEIAKTSFLAIGTGALVGIASYGGAMMFAHASTGTAIAALSGAAKTNATLAFFGGGSLKVGGLGIAGGKLVLAGIVIAPIIAVAAVITAVRAKARLAEAKKANAEAKNAATQMNTVTAGMKGIQQMSDNYCMFLTRFSNRFKPFINELISISRDYPKDHNGKIDFNALSEVEQKTIHLSWLMGQLFYKMLSVTILTDQGTIAEEAQTVFAASQKDYKILNKEATALENEKHKIAQLLSFCRTAITNAQNNLDIIRPTVSKALIELSNKKVISWRGTITTFGTLFSSFENVELDEKSITLFKISDEQIINDLVVGSESANVLYNNKYFNINRAFSIDFAISGGTDLLAEKTHIHNGNLVNVYADLSDTARWISGEQIPYSYIAGVDVNEVLEASKLVSSITGKENLATANQLNAYVSSVARKIDNAATSLGTISNISSSIIALIKQLDQLLRSFNKELSAIHRKFNCSRVKYEELQPDEQNVIKMSWDIAKLYYYALSMPILDIKGNLVSNVQMPIDYCYSSIKELKKKTFSMSGDQKRAANVIWRPNSIMAMVISFILIGCFFVTGSLMLLEGNLKGLILIGAMIVAFPVFFKFKRLPESKKMVWRYVRIGVSVIMVIVLSILI